MAQFLDGVLLVSFLASGYGAWVSFTGGWRDRADLVESGERTVILVFGLCSLLVGALVHAFLANNFSLEYVASYSSSTLPTLYKVSAVWAGQAGSLLFWAWLICLFSAIVVWQNKRQNRELVPHVIGVLLTTAFFFFGLMLYASSPFELLPVPPVDGRGLNPMLQNAGMVMHPPLLYLGYVGFSVPFGFAIAALITGNLDSQWIKTTRRWTLFAWIFLTLGNLFGAKWAYVELGWGGYWAWDPVENASLLPWLTGTAFLHSVMIQERRGMLKIWNVVLIVLTFGLTIFGTFITRSGVINSVHSFGVSRLGPLFLVFLGVTLGVSLLLLWKRSPDLKSEHHLDSFLSRESSFLFNNLILVGMAFAVFWGTVFPLLSEAVRDVRITVGPLFYNQVNVPIGLGLLALTGLCPLIGWRMASRQNLRRNFVMPVLAGIIVSALLVLVGMRSVYPIMSFALSTFVIVTILLEFFRGTRARVKLHGQNVVQALWELTMRNKRRYGGYVVHLGMVLIFVGITGSSAFQKELSIALAPGEKVEFEGYSIQNAGFADLSNDHAIVMAAELLVSRGGEYLETLYPAKQKHRNFETVSEVDIRQTLKEDLYVILTGMNDRKTAQLKILVIPLVSWIWIGGIVMIIGTVIVLGPDRIERTRKTLYSEEREVIHGV